MKPLLIVQLATYLGLAAVLASSNPRFAAAQALLFGVNALLFWEVLSA